jgi:hypothetical protein
MTSRIVSKATALLSRSLPLATRRLGTCFRHGSVNTIRVADSNNDGRLDLTRDVDHPDGFRADGRPWVFMATVE